MKLRADSVRKRLDVKIQEKELKDKEELRLKNEELKRKKEIEKERKKLDLQRLRDIKTLEKLVLDSSLEGKFQVEVNLEDLDYYYEDRYFSQLEEYGFEIISSESKPISNIRSFVLTTENKDLEKVQSKLTNHLNKLIEICKSKKHIDFLTFLSSYKKSDDIKVNVEYLTLLLNKAIEPIREFIEEDDSDFDTHDDFVSGSIDWHLKILSQIDFLEEDLEMLDLDDPSSSVTYDQFFLLWKKRNKSFTNDETLFEANNFNWIANKNGQQFFYYIQKAINKCVNDLESTLTLNLTLHKSVTSIIINSDEVFDSTTDDEDQPLIKNFYFKCPLSSENLVRIFEHLEFTTALSQEDENNNTPLTLEIRW